MSELTERLVVSLARGTGPAPASINKRDALWFSPCTKFAVTFFVVFLGEGEHDYDASSLTILHFICSRRSRVRPRGFGCGSISI